MTLSAPPAAAQAWSDFVDDDELYKTPTTVSWAVATGTGPLPFLGTYAVLFLVHGLFYPVSPPDITGSRTGEALAGFIAAVLFVYGSLSLAWFVNRRRRWTFVLGQLATFATAVDFVLDDTKGGRGVAVLLAVTSLISLVLAAGPDSWRHMGQRPPLEAWRARQARRPQGPVAVPAGADVAEADDAGAPATASAGARYMGRRRAGRS